MPITSFCKSLRNRGAPRSCAFSSPLFAFEDSVDELRRPRGCSYGGRRMGRFSTGCGGRHDPVGLAKNRWESMGRRCSSFEQDCSVTLDSRTPPDACQAPYCLRPLGDFQCRKEVDVVAGAQSSPSAYTQRTKQLFRDGARRSETPVLLVVGDRPPGLGSYRSVNGTMVITAARESPLHQSAGRTGTA